uniref:Apple domain-containing protein n=1 Tax=Acrobeloides nanus TaxID=290746 RepID=A0A914DQS7_9BILA
MLRVSLTILLYTYLLHYVSSTTEWFGDLRAHLNPESNPAFYDVTYDDDDCPLGLQSNAVPNYVYFGAVVATMSAKSHDECLIKCIRNSKCKAVNFFEPMSIQERAFCELLAESQLDNPRLTRPFRKSVYYDNIKCRTDEDLTPSAGIFTNVQRLHRPIENVKKIERTNDNKGKDDDILAFLKKFGPKIHQFNVQFRSRK